MPLLIKSFNTENQSFSSWKHCARFLKQEKTKEGQVQEQRGWFRRELLRTGKERLIRLLLGNSKRNLLTDIFTDVAIVLSFWPNRTCLTLPLSLHSHYLITRSGGPSKSECPSSSSAMISSSAHIFFILFK